MTTQPTVNGTAIDPEDTIRRALAPTTSPARRVRLLQVALGHLPRREAVQMRPRVWPPAKAAWEALTRGERTDALWSDIEHIRWTLSVPCGEVTR